MITIILSGIIVVLLCVIISQKISGAKGEVDTSKKEQKLMMQLHQREVDGLKEIEDKLQSERERIYQEQITIREQLLQEQNNLENYKTIESNRIAQELALYREEQLNKVKQELLAIDLQEKQRLQEKVECYKKIANQETEDTARAVENMKKYLDDLKAKRDNTLAIIKEEEKLKNENDFYRIVLKKEDVEDIDQLRSIEKRLNNKDVLRKLIYKTFIEIPMNSLFGRIGIKDAPGIYKITNLKNNMVYIGQSTNVKKRVKAHIQASIGISTIASQTVHDAMADEGLENFAFQLVEECEKDKLNNREKYYIDYYDSKNYGYNRTAGGART